MSESAAPYAQSQHSTTAMQINVVPKLPEITIVPDANPTYNGRRRNTIVTGVHQRALNSTSSKWNANFCDCCCSVAPTYCCIVTCCPCTTIASVKESLGGGYERTLLYFGGLVLGLLVCVGFAASNKSNEPAEASVSDTSPPPHRTDADSLIVWEALAAMFLMTFLFGVWRLRIQARHSLGIQGSLFKDCLSSFFCCFCVISQVHLELKCNFDEPQATRQTQYYRRGQSDANLASTYQVDTLAPYAVM